MQEPNKGELCMLLIRTIEDILIEEEQSKEKFKNWCSERTIRIVSSCIWGHLSILWHILVLNDKSYYDALLGSDVTMIM